MPHGYVCVRVDSRGARPITRIHQLLVAREINDFLTASNGLAATMEQREVGLAGCLLLREYQWQVAASGPCIWRALCLGGCHGLYRE